MRRESSTTIVRNPNDEKEERRTGSPNCRRAPSRLFVVVTSLLLALAPPFLLVPFLHADPDEHSTLRRLDQHRSLSPSPPAPPGDAPPNMTPPNLLLFMADQWRPDYDGRHPAADVRLPHLEALARRGARFATVVVPAPQCAPSRVAFALGTATEEVLTRRRIGRRRNGCTFCTTVDVLASTGDDGPTIYRQLQQAGYYTMTVGKDDLTKVSPSTSPTDATVLTLPIFFSL